MLQNQTIRSILSKDWSYGAALHRLGIPFYHHENDTLAEACAYRRIHLPAILKSLELFQQDLEHSPLKTLKRESVSVIIAYLRHSHQVFINQKLPYFQDLIQHLDSRKIQNPALVKDLQLVFPLFAEDFIHHIHEEEDLFFGYILGLEKSLYEQKNQGLLFLEMQKHSIQQFALDHDTHDDEMEGIRHITNNYDLGPAPSLHLEVLFMELKAFEQELLEHAAIENEILFPKALLLEGRIRARIAQQKNLN